MDNVKIAYIGGGSKVGHGNLWQISLWKKALAVR